MDVKIKKLLDQTIINHKISRMEQISSIELDEILKNTLDGLLPVSLSSSLLGKTLIYKAENCVELSNYIQQKISFEEFVDINLLLMENLLNYSNKNIRIQNIEMDPELMFYDFVGKQIKMIYWPMLALDKYISIKECLEKIADCYFGNIDLNNSEDKENYYMFLNSCNMSRLEMIQQGLQSLKKQDSITEYIDTYSEDTISQESASRLYEDIEATVGIWQEPFLMHVKTQKKIKLTRFPFSIGRSNSCDFCTSTIVQNGYIGKLHATLTKSDGKYCIVDNNSLNRVKINNELIPPNIEMGIKSGDAIEFADEKFVFYSA